MNNLLWLNKDITVYEMINDTYKQLQWGLRFMNIENTWQVLDCDNLKDIKIAIIDSGIDINHIELKHCIIGGYNFVDDDYNIQDYFEHGTNVAGIIGALKNNGFGIAGVASGVKVISLKVMDKDGKADIRNVNRALDWCIENEIDIVNISMGLSLSNSDFYDISYLSKIQAFRNSLKKANDNLIVVISSIGNNSYDYTDFPASEPEVISVGSYGIDFKSYEPSESTFNNKGKFDTIYAPGEYIFTTFMNNRFGYTMGTSISTAFVSSAVALIKSINKKIRPEQVKKLLLITAYYIGKDNNIPIINVDKAINYLLKGGE